MRFLGPVLALAVLLGACSQNSGTEQMWVDDNLVQCNAFDEPFRECLLVSHTRTGLYRHIEGGVEGFDYEEGTRYLLEVERLDTSGPRDTAYRLVQIVRTEG